MRLISVKDAAAIEKDPKAEVTTFYVEKCKGNTIPKHFMAEENKDKKVLKINGADVTVARNKERSEYCAFCTGDGETAECFYVRNHAFLDHSKEYVTFVKPAKPVKPKKTEEEKAAEKQKKADEKAAAKAEKDANKPAKAAKSGKSSAASEKAARDAAAGQADAPDGDTGAA